MSATRYIIINSPPQHGTACFKTKYKNTIYLKIFHTQLKPVSLFVLFYFLGKKEKKSKKAKYSFVQWMGKIQKAYTRAAQGKRNKLSGRDIRRVVLEVKRKYSAGHKIDLAGLTEIANATKDGINRVHPSTVSRHLKQAKVACDSSLGNWPAHKDPSRWLRQRRGFAKVFKCNDKTKILMGDEAFFGLRRKDRQNEKTWYPIGHKKLHKYSALNASKRVCVYGLVGPQYWLPLIIFEDGQFLTQEDYGRMMDGEVLPELARLAEGLIVWEDQGTDHGGNENDALFVQNKVTRKYLPSWSPDLSWIEKAWANLADRVYAGGKVYATKADLMVALQREWIAMMSNDQYRKGLVAQGEKACRKVLRNVGHRVHWD